MLTCFALAKPIIANFVIIVKNSFEYLNILFFPYSLFELSDIKLSICEIMCSLLESMISMLNMRHEHICWKFEENNTWQATIQDFQNGGANPKADYNLLFGHIFLKTERMILLCRSRSVNACRCGRCLD